MKLNHKNFFVIQNWQKSSLITLEVGAKIELRIPDEDEPEDSFEPKRSEANEEEDEEPILFVPSMNLSLCIYLSP